MTERSDAMIEHADALYTLHRGSTPLLVSVPHAGRHIPPALRPRYVERAFEVEDTDWHLDRLYAFARDIGAGLLIATHSRFVIDLNRPPDNAPMYPGKNNTELCPTHFFTGDPLYKPGQAPSEAEVQDRRRTYWQPYHDTLQAELDRLKAEHGHAALFEAHSIKSELPWLFEGTLPALNVGTSGGESCAPTMRQGLREILTAQDQYDWVMDERFKGGYITRTYGRPEQHIHAVQLEMCWRCYMAEDPPYDIAQARAGAVTPLLKQMLVSMRDWRPAS